jgi:hypothetical protein
MSDINQIDYDKLVENSLKNVISESLKIAEKDGLPGENHFYISFKTNFDGVNIPSNLLAQYPEEMTIVLQHQFSELKTYDDHFSVKLAFSGVPRLLEIPYESISYFSDPHAQFGLSFNVMDTKKSNNANFKIVEDEPEEDDDNAFVTEDNVVSLDAFRRKQ